VNGDFTTRAAALLEVLYPGSGHAVAADVAALVDRYVPVIGELGERPPPDERTTLLITYADAIDGPAGEFPLATLHRTLTAHIGDLITDVHLLPMFPSTSDDGFAVADYRNLDPRLGNWDDIAAMGHDYRLMFDFVANHVSASHPWLERALSGDPALADRFISFDVSFDPSRVVRPRTSPLFHDYPRPDGTVATLWTTFSADQVDLNVDSPTTLLELTDVLLGYLARGAASVRLDAIGFLAKRSGTTCMHLPQTHAVVKLWRLVTDTVRPGVQLVTETNVPHDENVSYFGDGHDEAHQVYQFALPPLVLHSFVSGTAAALSKWAATIEPVSTTATYLNFLATHDGIGMRPAEGLLTASQQQALVERVLANGGLVSMKSNGDDTEQVYELNVNFLDALATATELDDAEVVAAKGLCAHAILLSLVGVPAIYYHSLFGSTGDPDAARSSGIPRRINRAHLDHGRLAEALTTDRRRHLMLDGLSQLIRTRRRHPAFSPFASQQVERLDDRVFAVRRGSGAHAVLCLANVSNQTVELDVAGVDIATSRFLERVSLQPYAYLWLRPAERT
jgi:sucrose phosphorylase